MGETLKERLDRLSEGANPGPYSVRSYQSGTTYLELGKWPGHYASDTVPPMGWGDAEIVNRNIPSSWGDQDRKGYTAHFLAELGNAYRSGDLIPRDEITPAMAAEWQPIETAPKDGVGFLAFERISDDHYTISVCVWEDGDDGDGPYMVLFHEAKNIPVNASHWRPLPDPSALTAIKESKDD